MPARSWGSQPHSSVVLFQFVRFGEWRVKVRGKPAMLPVRGAVGPIAHHDGLRLVARRLGRGGGERGRQPVRRLVQRPRKTGDLAAETCRERLANGERVHEAARAAHVVLQDLKLARGIAHDVRAGDADPHVVRRPQPVHERLEVRSRLDHALGDDPVAHDPSLAVDVSHEGVQGAHALRESDLEMRPLLGRQDPWHRIDYEPRIALDRAERHADPGHVVHDAAGKGIEVMAGHRRHRRQRRRPRTAVRGDGLVVGPRRRRVRREEFVGIAGGHAHRPSSTGSTTY